MTEAAGLSGNNFNEAFFIGLQTGQGVFEIGKIQDFTRIEEVSRRSRQVIPDQRAVGYATTMRDQVVLLKHTGNRWEKENSDDKTPVIRSNALYVYDKRLFQQETAKPSTLVEP